MTSWYWPVVGLAGRIGASPPQLRAPVVSDGMTSWRTNEQGERFPHGGVDVMFRRATRDELVNEFPPGSPHGSRGYFMPPGALAIAAGPGRVWSAGWTRKGYAVVLDHGALATFYAHLERLLVDETARGRSGQLVDAGQPLGVVGGNPLDPQGLRHLHFEVWRGRPEHKLDPAPLLRTWGLVALDDHGEPFIARPPAARATRTAA